MDSDEVTLALLWSLNGVGMAIVSVGYSCKLQRSKNAGQKSGTINLPASNNFQLGSDCMILGDVF